MPQADARTPDKPPKSRRRWFQFSLRTLLILTTVSAVGFAWLGWWSHKARQQRAAVAAFIQAGGSVGYDISSDRFKQPVYWPVWLIQDRSIDYFVSVNLVELRNAKVTDSGLEHLKGLTGLRRLDLDGTQITDNGLEHLKGLKALQTLWLNETQVTDNGLEHLRGLTTLQWLRLDGTKVTDAGVARLQKALPNCEIEH
ncbi:MAG: hypothetical protein K8T25_00180 [Planctomycetia bacterium]|nr:hypothetical protein [Planctomycetia bacterium]